MSLDLILLAARTEHPDGRVLLERRARTLAAFFAPLGYPTVQTRFWPALGVMTGVITIGRDATSGDLIVWGEALPPPLRDVRRLLTAHDAELREIEGATGALAACHHHVRLVTAPSGPASLYQSAAPGCQAWSTSGVAAAWLASECVTLDLGALPELVAFDFVGGQRSLLENVSAVDAAMCVDLVPHRSWARCYWPVRDRWARADGRGEARAGVELLASLRRRLVDTPVPAALGLTGGADSRVAAIALRELGLDFAGFTWALDDQDDDARGACAVAHALGAPYRCEVSSWLDDAEAIASLDAMVRWTDGVWKLAFTERTWPRNGPPVIVGMGGETGRAFYYATAVGDPHSPSEGALLAAMAGGPPKRWNSHRAATASRTAARAWIQAARSTGHDGWRALDILYAEQRLRRWGRAQLPCYPGVLIPAFSSAPVSCALAGLSLEGRLSSGFHRDFIANHRPDLALPPPDPSPSPRSRRLTVASPPWRARRVAPRDRSGSVLTRLVQDRPGCRELVLSVADHPGVQAIFGPCWTGRLRRGLLAHQEPSTRTALALCGPLALERALADLPRAADANLAAHLRATSA